MHNTHYLIVGASHAAVAAAHAIRLTDAQRPLTMVSRDDTLPYSPTVLPYVVSGRSDAVRVFLRDEAYFRSQSINYLRGHAATRIDADRGTITLDDGAEVAYAKLLLATGARPTIPPVAGLDLVPYHVLRTLADATSLRRGLAKARRAVVLGAGLIGMHAAENLRKAGVAVTVVEMAPQVLPGYFDADAAALIAKTFVAAGVSMRLGARAQRISPTPSGFALELADGTALEGDLLLVGAGVTPVTDYLAGSGVSISRGVRVDDGMHTSVANVWAAGDLAEARSFYTGEPTLSGIVPYAVEQGRIAGMAMADDPVAEQFLGSVPLNTYSYFGQHALSVGSPGPFNDAETVVQAAQDRHLKIVLREGRLLGIFGINVPFDAGIMWEIVQRRIDLTPVREQFVADPQATGRAIMSRTWR